VNLAVLLHALRQSGRVTIALCAGTFAFFYLVFSASSAFLREASVELPFFQDPPRAMRALFGGSVDFVHPEGWLIAAMSHPITLALFTAAALSAAGGIAAEVERGTIDFVLTRPIRRSSYLLAVAMASLILLTATELVGFLTTLLARQTVSGVDQLSVTGVIRVFLGSWTVFAAMSMVGVLISANVSLRSRAIALSVGFVVLSFLINVAALMLDELYGLRRLSLFHYFEPTELIRSSSPLSQLIVPATAAVVALVAAVVTFTRRDIVR
jgi:ABC-2 type transport system permease protein